MAWKDDQEFEAGYWRNCYDAVAFGEIIHKHPVYARETKITDDFADQWGELDVGGRSILDLGCGPWSMLLRCYNSGRLVGLDPCDYPPSVWRRYKNYGIEMLRIPAEELPEDIGVFDEVWMYNILQHTMDPQLILEKAKRHARVLRIFDWVNIAPHQGHPVELKCEKLLEWLSGTKIECLSMKRLDDHLCKANCFAGKFICQAQCQ